MTVCVAAIASSGKEIITASDSMMSWGGVVTGETSLKYNRIHKRWAVMIAGDDVLPTETIIRNLSAALNANDEPTTEQVEQAIRESWRIVKNTIATTHVLSAYGLDLETFIQEGRETFGDIGFADLRSAVDRASELSCELLVYGFDEYGRGTLFVVVHPGEPVNFTRLGFAAIGSGRDSAIASLMWNPPHKTYHETLDSVYRVAAAKFMAESALGVGRDTTVSSLLNDGTAFVLTVNQVQSIRNLWESEGQPRIPRPHKIALLFNKKDLTWVGKSEQEEPTQGELIQPATIQDSQLSTHGPSGQPPSPE